MGCGGEWERREEKKISYSFSLLPSLLPSFTLPPSSPLSYSPSVLILRVSSAVCVSPSLRVSLSSYSLLHTHSLLSCPSLTVTIDSVALRVLCPSSLSFILPPSKPPSLTLSYLTPPYLHSLSPSLPHPSSLPPTHTHITGGVALRVFCPPGRAAQGAFALDAGVRALDFYDDFFQVRHSSYLVLLLCFILCYIIILCYVVWFCFILF